MLGRVGGAGDGDGAEQVRILVHDDDVVLAVHDLPLVGHEVGVGHGRRHAVGELAGVFGAADDFILFGAGLEFGNDGIVLAARDASTEHL